jgi:hypothetical protein
MAVDIAAIMRPSPDYRDTPVTAAVREHMTTLLVQLGDDPLIIKACYDLVTLMRDELMGRVAIVRRQATLHAKATMTVNELMDASGQTRQTVERLLLEARRR